VDNARPEQPPSSFSLLDIDSSHFLQLSPPTSPVFSNLLPLADGTRNQRSLRERTALTEPSQRYHSHPRLRTQESSEYNSNLRVPEQGLADFKERRDQRHQQLHNGRWEAYAIDGRKIRGTGYLAHTSDSNGNFLSTDLWVRSLAVAGRVRSRSSRVRSESRRCRLSTCILARNL
jgi:hypothetical protein